MLHYYAAFDALFCSIKQSKNTESGSVSSLKSNCLFLVLSTIILLTKTENQLENKLKQNKTSLEELITKQFTHVLVTKDNITDLATDLKYQSYSKSAAKNYKIINKKCITTNTAGHMFEEYGCVQCSQVHVCIIKALHRKHSYLLSVIFCKATEIISSKQCTIHKACEMLLCQKQLK